jgi:hypothetical protein
MAQIFGAGLLLLALGHLTMARASAPRDFGLRRMLAAAASICIAGGPARFCGLIGVPSPLQYLSASVLLLRLVGFVGLINPSAPSDVRVANQQPAVV